MERYKYADVLESIIRQDNVEYQYERKLGDKMWQTATDLSQVYDCMKHGYEVRIKPKTITIGGIEIPQPEKTAPENGVEYFVPSFATDLLYFTNYWYDYPVDRQLLDRGVVHLDRESAIAHTKALLSFTSSI